jgi:hypothetical protein
MTKKKKYDKIYVESTRQDLRRLQYWFAGFKAAGGIIPACADGLSSVQAAILILHDYNEDNDA